MRSALNGSGTMGDRTSGSRPLTSHMIGFCTVCHTDVDHMAMSCECHALRWIGKAGSRAGHEVAGLCFGRMLVHADTGQTLRLEEDVDGHWSWRGVAEAYRESAFADEHRRVIVRHVMEP